METFLDECLAVDCRCLVDVCSCPHGCTCAVRALCHGSRVHDKELFVRVQVTYDVSMHILAIIPTVLCGVLGGVFGTMFTVLNLKISRWRSKRIAPHRINRILEPVFIMFIYGTLATFIPNGFNCTTVSNCTYVDEVTRQPTNDLPEDEFFYTCGSPSRRCLSYNCLWVLFRLSLVVISIVFGCCFDYLLPVVSSVFGCRFDCL